MRPVGLAIIGDRARFEGRASKKIVRRRLVWRRRHYLALPLAGLFALLAAQFIEMAVDPFSLYPWSPPRRVLEGNYSIGLSPYLFRVVARSDYDTVMLGASTALNFLPSDMRAILSGTRTAVNLSYNAARPADMGVAFDEIARAKNVRRVLLTFDLTFAMPNDLRHEQFPFWLYDDDPTRHIFIFDKVAGELTLRLLLGQPLTIPRWNFAQFRRSLDRIYETWRSPASIATVQSTIEAKRAELAEPSRLSCRDLPAIERRLAPFAAALSAQGKRLDVIIPPYAINFYHDQTSDRYRRVIPRLSLDGTILMRRCLVDALSKFDGARIFAFDSERWLVEDLTNYYDVGHVYKEELYRYMLAEIDAGRHVLTRETFDLYASDLRSRVLNYRISKSEYEKAAAK